MASSSVVSTNGKSRGGGRYRRRLALVAAAVTLSLVAGLSAGSRGPTSHPRREPVQAVEPARHSEPATQAVVPATQAEPAAPVGRPSLTAAPISAGLSSVA